MRTVLLVAVLVAMAGSALAEERVLYCAETSNAGFIWKKGRTEGRVTAFHESRIIVTVQTETERIVTNVVGFAEMLTCRKPHPTVRPELLACDDGTGTTPWLFERNNFVHAFLIGPPVGGTDPKIWVSYGTCTGF
jgi:hypothetical protein